jgi:3-methyladenine DNA glycosylase AlkD
MGQAEKQRSQTEPNRSGPETQNLEVEINRRLARLGLAGTAEIRKLRREFSERLKSSSPDLINQLALGLVRQAPMVPRFFAYELILHDKRALRSLNAKTLEQLGVGIESWGEVDAFACDLAGPVWREHQVPDTLIKRWARSSNRWWRRAAVVSTVPLNNKARGGNGDAKRTLLICELVLQDRDDMVVKALSWALRELSKRDAKEVEKFIRAHRNIIAPRVYREVTNKLSTGLKNPRKSIARKLVR